jgi:hypothetical protein
MQYVVQEIRDHRKGKEWWYVKPHRQGTDGSEWVW